MVFSTSAPDFVKQNSTPPTAGGLSGSSALACQEVQKSGKSSTSYNQSLHISGNVIQVRQFSESVQCGPRRRKKKPTLRDEYGIPGDEGRFSVSPLAVTPKRLLTAEEQAQNARKNGRRALTTLLRKVNSNFGLKSRLNRPGQKSIKFFTGTMTVNFQDLDAFERIFTRFIDRLEYHLQEKVEYIAVPELQQRGAWHVHVILYSSFIPLSWLLANWSEATGQGSFDISRIRHVNDIGRYVGKYVGKTFEEAQVSSGRHRYWCSKGLKDLTVKLTANHYDLSALGRGKRGMSLGDMLEYFQAVLLRSRIGSYEGEWTGVVEFLELVLTPGNDTEYLIRTLIDRWPWLTSS